jgi:4-aminobutyrate aminotransferase/(S)-3-amino-2-methylpropionate transaminase
MLISTGAEAVENAIKIARQATKREAVLCFTDAYHGRTMMAMTLTSKVDYKLECGPFAPEVYRIPFPNFYRYAEGKSLDEFVDISLRKLHASAKNLIDPKNLAAVIIEPIQGEGGFNPVPQKYFEGLRDFCDQHGIMLIADEVQSGFARTGHWASWQHYNVQPDLSTYAKSMGSGLPIAAVVGRAEVMDAAAPGTIGGTYIGSPLACAASLATIQYMKDINLNERAIEIGKIVMDRFEKIKKECPEVGDVRGLGAMNAIEFVKNGDPHQPDGDLCAAVVKGCAEKGLIIISAGTYKNMIRILSPLVISNELLNKGLDIIEQEITNKSKKINK